MDLKENERDFIRYLMRIDVQRTCSLFGYQCTRIRDIIDEKLYKNNLMLIQMKKINQLNNDKEILQTINKEVQNYYRQDAQRVQNIEEMNQINLQKQILMIFILLIQNWKNTQFEKMEQLYEKLIQIKKQVKDCEDITEKIQYIQCLFYLYNVKNEFNKIKVQNNVRSIQMNEQQKSIQQVKADQESQLMNLMELIQQNIDQIEVYERKNFNDEQIYSGIKLIQFNLYSISYLLMKNQQFNHKFYLINKAIHIGISIEQLLKRYFLVDEMNLILYMIIEYVKETMDQSMIIKAYKFINKNQEELNLQNNKLEKIQKKLNKLNKVVSFLNQDNTENKKKQVFSKDDNQKKMLLSDQIQSNETLNLKFKTQTRNDHQDLTSPNQQIQINENTNPNQIINQQVNKNFKGLKFKNVSKDIFQGNFIQDIQSQSQIGPYQSINTTKIEKNNNQQYNQMYKKVKDIMKKQNINNRQQYTKTYNNIQQQNILDISLNKNLTSEQISSSQSQTSQTQSSQTSGNLNFDIKSLKQFELKKNESGEKKNHFEQQQNKISSLKSSQIITNLNINFNNKNIISNINNKIQNDNIAMVNNNDNKNIKFNDEYFILNNKQQTKYINTEQLANKTKIRQENKLQDFSSRQQLQTESDSQNSTIPTNRMLNQNVDNVIKLMQQTSQSTMPSSTVESLSKIKPSQITSKKQKVQSCGKIKVLDDYQIKEKNKLFNLKCDNKNKGNSRHKKLQTMYQMIPQNSLQYQIQDLSESDSVSDNIISSSSSNSNFLTTRNLKQRSKLFNFPLNFAKESIQGTIIEDILDTNVKVKENPLRTQNNIKQYDTSISISQSKQLQNSSEQESKNELQQYRKQQNYSQKISNQTVDIYSGSRNSLQQFSSSIITHTSQSSKQNTRNYMRRQSANEQKMFQTQNNLTQKDKELQQYIFWKGVQGVSIERELIKNNDEQQKTNTQNSQNGDQIDSNNQLNSSNSSRKITVKAILALRQSRNVQNQFQTEQTQQSDQSINQMNFQNFKSKELNKKEQNSINTESSQQNGYRTQSLQFDNYEIKQIENQKTHKYINKQSQTTQPHLQQYFNFSQQEIALRQNKQNNKWETSNTCQISNYSSEESKTTSQKTLFQSRRSLLSQRNQSIDEQDITFQQYFKNKSNKQINLKQQTNSQNQLSQDGRFNKKTIGNQSQDNDSQIESLTQRIKIIENQENYNITKQLCDKYQIQLQQIESEYTKENNIQESNLNQVCRLNEKSINEINNDEENITEQVQLLQIQDIFDDNMHHNQEFEDIHHMNYSKNVKIEDSSYNYEDLKVNNQVKDKNQINAQLKEQSINIKEQRNKSDETNLINIQQKESKTPQSLGQNKKQNLVEQLQKNYNINSKEFLKRTILNNIQNKYIDYINNKTNNNQNNEQNKIIDNLKININNINLNECKQNKNNEIQTNDIKQNKNIQKEIQINGIEHTSKDKLEFELSMNPIISCMDFSARKSIYKRQFSNVSKKSQNEDNCSMINMNNSCYSNLLETERQNLQQNQQIPKKSQYFNQQIQLNKQYSNNIDNEIEESSNVSSQQISKPHNYNNSLIDNITNQLDQYSNTYQKNQLKLNRLKSFSDMNTAKRDFPEKFINFQQQQLTNHNHDGIEQISENRNDRSSSCAVDYNSPVNQKTLQNLNLKSQFSNAISSSAKMSPDISKRIQDIEYEQESKKLNQFSHFYQQYQNNINRDEQVLSNQKSLEFKYFDSYTNKQQNRQIKSYQSLLKPQLQFSCKYQNKFTFVQCSVSILDKSNQLIIQLVFANKDNLRYSIQYSPLQLLEDIQSPHYSESETIWPLVQEYLERDLLKKYGIQIKYDFKNIVKSTQYDMRITSQGNVIFSSNLQYYQLNQTDKQGILGIKSIIDNIFSSQKFVQKQNKLTGQTIILINSGDVVSSPNVISQRKINSVSKTNEQKSIFNSQERIKKIKFQEKKQLNSKLIPLIFQTVKQNKQYYQISTHIIVDEQNNKNTDVDQIDIIVTVQSTQNKNTIESIFKIKRFFPHTQFLFLESKIKKIIKNIDLSSTEKNIIRQYIKSKIQISEDFNKIDLVDEIKDLFNFRNEYQETQNANLPLFMQKDESQEDFVDSDQTMKFNLFNYQFKQINIQLNHEESLLNFSNQAVNKNSREIDNNSQMMVNNEQKSQVLESEEQFDLNDFIKQRRNGTRQRYNQNELYNKDNFMKDKREIRFLDRTERLGKIVVSLNIYQNYHDLFFSIHISEYNEKMKEYSFILTKFDIEMVCQKSISNIQHTPKQIFIEMAKTILQNMYLDNKYIYKVLKLKYEGKIYSNSFDQLQYYNSQKQSFKFRNVADKQTNQKFLQRDYKQTRTILHQVVMYKNDFSIISIERHLQFDAFIFNMYFPKSSRKLKAYLSLNELKELSQTDMRQILREISHRLSRDYLKDFSFSDYIQNQTQSSKLQYRPSINFDLALSQQFMTCNNLNSQKINLIYLYFIKLAQLSKLEYNVSKELKEFDKFCKERNKKVMNIFEINNHKIRNTKEKFEKFKELRIWEKILSKIQIVQKGDQYFLEIGSSVVIPTQEYLTNQIIRIDSSNDCYCAEYYLSSRKTASNNSMFEDLQNISYTNSEEYDIFIRFYQFGQDKFIQKRINTRSLLNLQVADGFFKNQANYSQSKIFLCDLYQLCYFVSFKILNLDFPEIQSHLQSSKYNNQSSLAIYKRNIMRRLVYLHVDEDKFAQNAKALESSSYTEILSSYPQTIATFSFHPGEKQVRINLYLPNDGLQYFSQIYFTELDEVIPLFRVQYNSGMNQNLFRQISSLYKQQLLNCLNQI